MIKRIFIALILMATIEKGSAGATTWYVDGSVSSSGDGKSWASAFKKIQEGIDAATDGDTVIVSEGVYCEEIQFKVRNICLTSRNPQSSSVRDATVIDGQGSGYRIPVRFTGWEDETCVLKGFTIRNGFDRGATAGFLEMTRTPQLRTTRSEVT